MKSKLAIVLAAILGLIILSPLPIGFILRKMAKNYQSDVAKEMPGIFWLEKKVKRGFLMTIAESTLKFKDKKGIEEVQFTHEYAHYPDFEKLMEGQVVLRVVSKGKLIWNDEKHEIDPGQLTVLSEFNLNHGVLHNFELAPQTIKSKLGEMKIGAVKGKYSLKNKYDASNEIILDSLEAPPLVKVKNVSIIQTTPELSKDLVSYNTVMNLEITAMGIPVQMNAHVLAKNLKIEKIELLKTNPEKSYEILFPPFVFELTKFTFKLADNEINGKGEATLSEKVADAKGKEALKYLNAHFELRANKTQAHNLLTEYFKKKSKEPIPPEMKDALFKDALQRKLIVEEDEDYVLLFEKAESGMTINGADLETVFPKPSTAQAVAMVDTNQNDEVLYQMAKEKSINAEEDYSPHHQAIEVAETILKRNPNFAYAYELKALAYRHLAHINTKEDDPELINNAEKEINLALQIKVDEPLFLLEKGRILNKQKRLGEAHELVDKVIAAHPTLALALLVKAWIYDNQKNNAEVEKYLIKLKSMSLTMIEQKGVDRLWLGIYQEKGMNQEAEAIHLKFLAQKPTPWNHNDYGVFLSKIDRRREAIIQYDKCLALADIGMCHYNKGNNLRRVGIDEYKSGNYSQALSHLQSALVENAEDGKAMANLALVYNKMGDKPNAKVYFEKACKLGEDSACRNLEKANKRP